MVSCVCVLPGSLKLLLHAGDGLLEVAEHAVDLAQLSVGPPRGRRRVVRAEIVSGNQTLL